MTTEENKALVRKWLDLWNQHALDELAALVTPNYIHHTSSGEGIDFARFQQGFTWILRAYPDMHYAITHVLAEKDLVAVYLVGQGTQQGSFYGIAPTGQPSVFSGVYHCRIQDGLIAEDWDIFDLLTALLRLGVSLSVP